MPLGVFLYYAYYVWRFTRRPDTTGSLTRDIEHAHAHAITWVELGDDPMRYLVVGPDRSGNLLELVVIHTAEPVELVIHTMALRRSTGRELFGGEQG